jgi:ATP-binding cassette subfamily B protein
VARATTREGSSALRARRLAHGALPRALRPLVRGEPQARDTEGVVSSALSFIGTLGYYAAYIVIIARAIAGSITLGSLTFLAASFSRGRDLIQRLLLGASAIYEQGLYLRDLFLFFEMKPTISSPPGAPPVPRPIRRGFVFENVGFKYAGQRSVGGAARELHARPGVTHRARGENGAGKTTLTKLLIRKVVVMGVC